MTAAAVLYTLLRKAGEYIISRRHVYVIPRRQQHAVLHKVYENAGVKNSHVSHVDARSDKNFRFSKRTRNDRTKRHRFDVAGIGTFYFRARPYRQSRYVMTVRSSWTVRIDRGRDHLDRPRENINDAVHKTVAAFIALEVETRKPWSTIVYQSKIVENALVCISSRTPMNIAQTNDKCIYIYICETIGFQ